VDPRRIEAARTHQRRAQFLADYIEAENSMGFHADQEAARVLGLSINYARLGTEALFGDGSPDAEPTLIASPPATVVPGEGRPGSVFQHRTNTEVARPGP
jgi:nitrite reductase (cytochrome c-552)